LASTSISDENAEVMSIPFVRDDHTKGPGVYDAAPGLTRIVAGNAGPFTYTGTGTYILHNDDACAVIDPGPDLSSHIKTLVDFIGPRAVDVILVTHTHRDHSPAAAPLKAITKAPIWGCRPVTATGAPDGGIQLDEAQDTTYAPDRVLKDGEVLEFDYATLKTVETPGHIANHLCFHWAETNALFSGDHIMGWATSVVIPPDGNMTDYMTSLEKTLAMELDCLWPTHGQPVTNPQPFITALIAHRKQREAAILDQIQGGNGLIARIVEQLYSNIPPALHPAAAQSVFAHVLDLIDKGRVKAPERVEIGAFYFPS